MLGMEEVLLELSGEHINEQGLPPGFRFHPTDEELITFYLASKVFNGTLCGVDIVEVDLNRCEPWELPDVAKMGEKEWFFFSLRDRKYPTGLRTNRATGAGYWKATGKDREVYSASNGSLLGMKKTLVFYKGRAPRGEKTKWVMHEYRLDGNFSSRHTRKEEWVICRIYHKTGEKKNPIFHGRQSCLPALLEAQPTPTPMKASSSLLEEYEFTTQNPMRTIPSQNLFLNSGSGNDLKSLITNNPVVSQSHLFPIHGLSTSSTIATTNKNPSISTSSSSSVLFKSLLSHQNSTWNNKQQCQEQPLTVPKQCKTETNFSHFQAATQPLLSSSTHPDKDNYNNFLPNNYNNNNTMLFESDDYGVLGLLSSSSNAAPLPTHLHDMSTSAAANFNRTGSQFRTPLSDPLIKLAGGESWTPFDAY
ncbi:hypothetical protein CsatB_007906 [Cannabis sativa]|uniref:NAC domain-containing protein n=1 Tax=Cannabis sativa TaxID=3483 RepID=A0A7J6DUY6_CANSA|nr:protein CUP-SHAPED COTYLEDON 3 [Cannabis sativa]KAF4349379.1 hypothetical protein F8388_012549 [Cannabis sativa]KAF4370477.1 hypothetical protein G4B88_005198 [Cannabis sativa]